MRRVHQVLLFCTILGVVGAVPNDSGSQCVGQEPQSKIYSGPQPNEQLPSFLMKGVFDDQAGKDIDVVELAKTSPTVVVFFHERSRPAFRMTNALMKYAATRQEDGLVSAVCFLGDDFSATTSWVQNIRRNLSDDVHYGVSEEGIEGPGAYGLNRNVSLTILVAKDRKVTANFALLQPSIPGDGPGIMKALVDVLGGGDVPSLAEFAPAGRGDAPRNDPQLVGFVRRLVETTDSEELEKRIAEIEEYTQQRPRIKAQLTRLASGIQNSPRMDMVQLNAAREKIRQWASEAPPTDRRMEATDSAVMGRLRPLLADVIRKNASDEQVQEAAAKVEKEASQDAALKKAIGEAAARVVNSGNLGNYGTAKAQEFLKKWADEFLKDDR